LEQIIFWLGALGTAVFAISGALAAMRRELDPFGLVVIALVTAVGGGTLRDIILDVPVFWVTDPTTLYIALIFALITPFWGRLLESRKNVLILADAIGLALFAVTGTEKALSYDADPSVAVAMGVMSAAAGGMIRDILCNEIPLVLKKELYALPAIAGGGCFVLLHSLAIDKMQVIIISCGVTLVIRLVAIKYSISMPAVGKRNN